MNVFAASPEEHTSDSFGTPALLLIKNAEPSSYEKEPGGTVIK